MQFWANRLDVDVDVRLCCVHQANSCLAAFCVRQKDRSTCCLPCAAVVRGQLLYVEGRNVKSIRLVTIWSTDTELGYLLLVCIDILRKGRLFSYICMLKFAPNLKACQKDEFFCQRDATTPGTGPGIFLKHGRNEWLIINQSNSTVLNYLIYLALFNASE